MITANKNMIHQSITLGQSLIHGQAYPPNPDHIFYWILNLLQIEDIAPSFRRHLFNFKLMEGLSRSLVWAPMTWYLTCEV